VTTITLKKPVYLSRSGGPKKFILQRQVDHLRPGAHMKLIINISDMLIYIYRQEGGGITRESE
jgi:hypothetical protein